MNAEDTRGSPLACLPGMGNSLDLNVKRPGIIQKERKFSCRAEVKENSLNVWRLTPILGPANKSKESNSMSIEKQGRKTQIRQKPS
jgi:hypothetical protein